MLNNKNSFLKRARIAMVALVTVLGIGSAFATKAPAHQNPTWGVVGVVGDQYEVRETSAGFCSSSAGICKITSAAMPVDGLIPIEEANVVDNSGAFQLF